MNKKNKDVFRLGFAALLIIFLVAGFFFLRGCKNSAKYNEHIVEIGSVAKDSVICDNGTYLYYTSHEGNIMYVDPYDEKNASIWNENMSILDINQTEMLVIYKDEVALLNIEEKGIVDTYSINSDNIQFTSEAVYYVDKNTKHLMRVDRQTKEESELIPFEIVEFATYGDDIIYVQEGENKGITSLNVKNIMAMFYANDKTVTDIYVSGEGFIYYKVKGEDELYYVYILSGTEEKTEYEFEDFAFLKGAFFYKTKTDGKYTLIMDKKDIY